MLYKNALLHGIGEIRQLPDSTALRLQRVPESVRDGLEDPARAKVLNPGGAEIRFVLGVDGKRRATCRVTLSSDEGEGTVQLFNGTFDRRDAFYTIGSEPITIEVTMPDDLQGDRFRALPVGIASTLRFHPNVCRLVLRHGNMILHGIEGDIRPPTPAELPDKTMMAYGTSITHGAAASAFHLTYVAQTAWRLKTDLLNFGVGGACRAETAFADYLAAVDGWDFATLALSVNMLGAGFTAEEFHDRTKYLIGKVAGDNPDKPVFCISLYPYFGDWADLQPNAKATPSEYRQILEDVVRELSLPNTHFIPGPEILTRVDGLTVDMIHPGDLAMIDMGENLAARIASVTGA